MPLPPSPPGLPPELSIRTKNVVDMPRSTSPYATASPISPPAGLGGAGATDTFRTQAPMPMPIRTTNQCSQHPPPRKEEGQARVTPTATTAGPRTRAQQQTPSTTPPQFCCPCDAFRGWKHIPLRGRRASRSFSDLHKCASQAEVKSEPRERSSWVYEWDDEVLDSAVHNTLSGDNEGAGDKSAVAEGEEDDDSEESRSRLDLLPPELLDQIISYLSLDIPPNGYTPRNMDLVSCLLTCRALHSATLSVLYRNITIPTSIIFSKFLARLRDHPAVGTMIRRLDLSHFSSVGLGRTMEMNATIQNLTCHTLLSCLELLPYLRECLFQEHLEDDISPAIIHRLLSETSSLVALDFCGCSSEKFSDGFLHACTAYGDFPHALPHLQRLSLHECTSLSPAVFSALLPCLPNLTHLDVSHTQITTEALHSLPSSARLTHLSLSRCSHLTGAEVVRFLTTHPAACSNTLVYLNCMTDASRSRLFDESNMTALLPKLGPRLRSLNIGGARLTPLHVPLLRKLCEHLEELGLAMVGLRLEDVNGIFTTTTTGAGAPGQKKSTLRYIDLTSTPGLTHATLVNPRVSVLTTEVSAPLTVIELSVAVINPLRERLRSYPGASPTTATIVNSPTPTPTPTPTSPSPSPAQTDVELSARYGNGWVVRDLGRRQWYVRGYGAAGAAASGVLGSECEARQVDCGRRAWKMGAWWWGMKKVPVVVGDVGGLYGHYMFKR